MAKVRLLGRAKWSSFTNFCLIGELFKWSPRKEKTKMEFKLHSEYQPQAIEALVNGFQEGNQFQTLLGVRHLVSYEEKGDIWIFLILLMKIYFGRWQELINAAIWTFWTLYGNVVGVCPCMRKQIQTDIKELQEEGKLERKGSNRKGRWIIKHVD